MAKRDEGIPAHTRTRQAAKAARARALEDPDVAAFVEEGRGVSDTEGARRLKQVIKYGLEKALADAIRRAKMQGSPVPGQPQIPKQPVVEAAPRIPQRMEPYGGAQFGGYLPTPHPQWGGLGGYAPPGATPEMLAPYRERISATTEMARNRLADIIRRWETFKAAHPWRGPAAPALWGGTAMPGAMPPTAMPQAPVAQNPIELLRQRQLQAQQGLQQQALAGQQARQAAGSQLANMRWNPQEMQQFGQQMPGTRTFPGQIFPEAPQLNLFPGGSYQGSVTSPWEGW